MTVWEWCEVFRTDPRERMLGVLRRQGDALTHGTVPSLRPPRRQRISDSRRMPSKGTTIMDDKDCPVLVGVFGDRSRAERAATELLSQGFSDEELGIIWFEGTLPCGVGGLATNVGQGLAPHLTGLGLGEKDTAYYGTEVSAGRCLILVGGAPRPGLARSAIGRNCGSVHLPEAVKAA